MSEGNAWSRLREDWEVVWVKPSYKNEFGEPPFPHAFVVTRSKSLQLLIVAKVSKEQMQRGSESRTGDRRRTARGPRARHTSGPVTESRRLLRRGITERRRPRPSRRTRAGYCPGNVHEEGEVVSEPFALAP
jgi:hypothetical protein